MVLAEGHPCERRCRAPHIHSSRCVAAEAHRTLFTIAERAELGILRDASALQTQFLLGWRGRESGGPCLHLSGRHRRFHCGRVEATVRRQTLPTVGAARRVVLTAHGTLRMVHPEDDEPSLGHHTLLDALESAFKFLSEPTRLGSAPADWHRLIGRSGAHTLPHPPHSLFAPHSLVRRLPFHTSLLLVHLSLLTPLLLAPLLLVLRPLATRGLAGGRLLLRVRFHLREVQMGCCIQFGLEPSRPLL
eukprot:scaffold14056_cov74-Phaeocystis_antarctica.AAC.2